MLHLLGRNAAPLGQGSTLAVLRMATSPVSSSLPTSMTTRKSQSPRQPKLIPIPEDTFTGCYKIEKIEAVVAGATVPAVVQVWATEYSKRTTDSDTRLIVNRTPAVADLSVQVGSKSYIGGCGLHWLPIGTVPKAAFGLMIAITSPAVALISDGKTPDLSPFREGLANAIGAALTARP